MDLYYTDGRGESIKCGRDVSRDNLFPVPGKYITIEPAIYFIADNGRPGSD